MIIFLVGCSAWNEPSVGLTNKSVDIHIADKDIQHLDASNQIEESFSTVSLRYNFSIKNTGSQTVGGIEEPNPETFEMDDGLKYTIEPSEELLKLTIELFGFNIFDESERVANNLGMGKSIIPMLKAGEVGDNVLDFDLGVKEQTDQYMTAPSMDLLNTLKENALNSTLIVSVKDREIARFKLNE
ncbi:hypothetical protein R4Z10_09180 [Niallia sp. XMNu-256]|uniref:hypothetical protein n=1 Tax=Niallia sp. XMNu-256 TaxID=3082444 RepID=UPI0030CBA639